MQTCLLYIEINREFISIESKHVCIIYAWIVHRWIVNRVCVYVCVCTSIHREGFICLDQVGYQEQINDVMLKTLNSSADSLHRYFGMQNLTFQLAALSCSQNRSDLSSVRLVFRTWGLHSLFSRRCLWYALHRELICFCVNTHESVRNLSRKG